MVTLAISRNAHLKFEHPAVQHTLVRCWVAVGVQHVNCVCHPVLQFFHSKGELIVLGDDSVQSRHFLLEMTETVF